MTGEQSKKTRSVYDRLLNGVSNITAVVTGAALVFLTIIFGWLVFGRYVLNATPTWVEQAALLLVVYIGFLGATIGVHRKTHLGVSVFLEMSPKPVQKFFELLTHILLCGFGLMMVIYGYKLTCFKWDALIPLIRISEGFRSLPILLSGVLIVLYSIGHLIHFFNDSDTGQNKEQ